MHAERRVMTDRGGGSGEGQAEQHEEGHHFPVGLHVGQAQAPVVAGVAREHGLEHVRQLQEVQTDHRRGQDGELSARRGATHQAPGSSSASASMAHFA